MFPSRSPWNCNLGCWSNAVSVLFIFVRPLKQRHRGYCHSGCSHNQSARSSSISYHKSAVQTSNETAREQKLRHLQKKMLWSQSKRQLHCSLYIVDNSTVTRCTRGSSSVSTLRLDSKQTIQSLPDVWTWFHFIFTFLILLWQLWYTQVQCWKSYDKIMLP